MPENSFHIPILTLPKPQESEPNAKNRGQFVNDSLITAKEDKIIGECESLIFAKLKEWTNGVGFVVPN